MTDDELYAEMARIRQERKLPLSSSPRISKRTAKYLLGFAVFVLATFLLNFSLH
jgi:hypothetical protein